MARILTQAQPDYPPGSTLGTRKFIEDKGVKVVTRWVSRGGTPRRHRRVLLGWRGHRDATRHMRPSGSSPGGSRPMRHLRKPQRPV